MYTTQAKPFYLLDPNSPLIDAHRPSIEVTVTYTQPVHYIDVLKQYQKDMKDYKRIYSTQEAGYRFKAA